MPAEPKTKRSATPRNPVRIAKSYLSALALLPMLLLQVRNLEANTARQIAELSARLDALEGSLGALAGGKNAAERQAREEALLNQIASVPIAIREVTLRLNRLERPTAEIAS